MQEEISWRKHSRKPPNSYKKSGRVRPCEEIGKNDVRQALRKNLKCGCLLKFSEEQPKHGKVIETNHNEEVSIRSATKDDPEKKGRTLGTAKSLREFEQMDWIPIDFGRLFDKARPHPNQRGMAKVIAEDFPPDNHT